MCRLFLLGCLFSIATLSCLGQDETTGENNSLLVSAKANKRVLVVPMMDKMFMSNVSHEIGRYNGLNFREVRQFFKAFISDNLELASLSHWSLSEISEEGDSLELMAQISLGYDYQLVENLDKKEESKVSELWRSLQKKASGDNAKIGAYLEDGEVKEFYDGKERFMHAKVDTAFVFGEALKSLSFDYLLFINELDINKPSSASNFSTTDRTIKLHFTLYSSKGERIFGNATYASFEENTLDIYKIANNALLSAMNRMLAECSVKTETQKEN